MNSAGRSERGWVASSTWSVPPLESRSSISTARIAGRASSTRSRPLRTRRRGSWSAARIWSTRCRSTSGEVEKVICHVQWVTAACSDGAPRSTLPHAVARIPSGSTAERRSGSVSSWRTGARIADPPERPGRCRCTRRRTRGRWRAPGRSAASGGVRTPRCRRWAAAARRMARSQIRAMSRWRDEADLAVLGEADPEPHDDGSCGRRRMPTGTGWPGAGRGPGRCPGCRRPGARPRPRRARSP